MNTCQQVFIIHYAEIALKGKNRKSFELQLIHNIHHALGPSVVKIVRQFGQIVLSVEQSNNQIIESLSHVFGISWFAPVQVVDLNLQHISIAAVDLARQTLSSTTTFAVRAERSTKSLPFTSLDIEKHVGDQIRLATKAKVDLTHPRHTIYIYVSPQNAYVFSQKIAGPGGLLVGSSGKVLVLLSGGFDSIAAAYMLARRGARVDFLHFHIFTNTQKVIDSKIHTIARHLSDYTLSKHLYLVSNLDYQMAILDLPKGLEKQELIVFRRLMVGVGERLAQKHAYQALVLGDSLGQVASQTIENIAAVDQAVEIPIFRPLIGSDKIDIVNLVKTIGLESTINLPYKDCCSIISHHPATKANLDKIHAIEDRINTNQIVDQIVDQVETVPLSNI